MTWQNRAVLVTGGCGFIGSHLVEALVGPGACVTVVDDLRSGAVANLQTVLHLVAFHRWDVGSEDFLRFLERSEFDIVFHLASNSYVPPSVKDPSADFHNNLVNTLAVLEAFRSSNNPARLIYPSSAAVYGNPTKFPISEDDPTVPISPYGVSKLAAERYVKVYSGMYGIRAASLRLFSVYGPRQTKQVVYDFLCGLRDDPTRLHVLGDGQQVRDFSYVRDVVTALTLVADSGALEGEVYNVASGTLCTIETLAETIAAHVGAQPTLVFDEAIKAGRSGDPDKWVADTARLRQLGFKPSFSLEEGLRETVDWFNSYRGRSC